MGELLYNSLICRLCGIINNNGINLFDETTKLYLLVNKHVRLKVCDDGIMPKTICPGCRIHLEDTATFFDLIREGQKIIQQILQTEKKQKQNPASENDNMKLELPFNKHDETASNSPNVDDGVCKVKKKRGRPKKGDTTSKMEEAIIELPPRTPRQRKLPKKFGEVVQGKEMEEILRDAGIENEDDERSLDVEPVTPITEVIGQLKSKSGEDLGAIILFREGEQTKTLFQCEFCGHTFTRKSIFLNHKKENVCSHNNDVEKCQPNEGLVEEEPLVKAEKQFQCPFCEKMFYNKKVMECHINKSHKKMKWEYGCEYCERKFNAYPSLLYHEEADHNRHMYICKVCSKPFSHRQLLARHSASHKEDRPYCCQLCFATFKHLSNLRSHETSHLPVQPFTCDVCRTDFKTKRNLVVHVKTLHNQEKPFECHVCKKGFSQKGNMIEHLRVHTGEKPFRCQVCGCAFKTSSQLRTHKMLHAADKPHRCEICSKKFIHREMFEAHQRRHKGEKMFVCKLCDKAFTELMALKKHVRVHTGEKRYKCSLCSRPFSDSSNLAKHKKLAHGNKGEESNLAVELEELVQQTTNTQPIVYLNMVPPLREQLEIKSLELNTDIGERANEEGDSLRLAISDTKSTLEEMIQLNGLEDNSRKIVTDEMGNPLKITMADGSQLQLTTMDGESLQAMTSDGVPIQVKISSDIDLTPLSTPSSLTNIQSLGVGLSELTRLTDVYDVGFTTEDGQNIQILSSETFGVQTLTWKRDWDLAS